MTTKSSASANQGELFSCETRASCSSKRSKGYNSLKNTGVFLNIVGVAAVAAHIDIS